MRRSQLLAVKLRALVSDHHGRPIETDAETWLLLVTGSRTWAQALAEGVLRVSGTRAALDGLLPLAQARGEY